MLLRKSGMARGMSKARWTPTGTVMGIAGNSFEKSYWVGLVASLERNAKGIYPPFFTSDRREWKQMPAVRDVGAQ